MTTLSEVAAGLRQLADRLDTITAPVPANSASAPIIHAEVFISTCTADDWWAWRDAIGPDHDLIIVIDDHQVRAERDITADVRLSVYGATYVLCKAAPRPRPVLAPRPEAT